MLGLMSTQASKGFITTCEQVLITLTDTLLSLPLFIGASIASKWNFQAQT